MISTVAGTGRTEVYRDSGPATATGLYAPRGIALDKAGNLYIADSHQGCVRRVDPGGLLTTVAGSNPRSAKKGVAPQYLLNPVGLAVGPYAEIYWADPTLNRVKKADLSHTDPETKSSWITIVAGNATMGFSGDGSLAREAELAAPAALAFDSRGHLYIADHSNQRIRRVDALTGIITTIAGNGERGFSGDGGPAIEAAFNAPSGLAFDAQDNLYIADAQNHRIRRIDATTGILTTVAGSGPVDDASPKGKVVL
jgi:sugar lactone lactonase YvrE